MKQYIDKADVVAEIEKRIKEIDEIGTYLSPKGVLTNFLCHINTLEVKEVDLEKELDRYTNSAEYVYNETRDSYFLVAKHFFELGLKAQKGN